MVAIENRTLARERLPAIVTRWLHAPLWALAFFVAGCATPHGGIPLPGNENLHQVDARLYRSAQPEIEGFTALAARGIKTVINLRMPSDRLAGENIAAQANGLIYLEKPMSGWRGPTEAQVNEVLALIDASAPPVLVHCQRGADRTGTIVACYRIRHDSWTADQAIAEAEAFGMAWGQIGMKAFIREFERKEHRR